MYELNVSFDASGNPVIGSPSFKVVGSTGYPTAWHKCYPGDFNGDGITDVLTRTTAGLWEIGYGKGNGLFNDILPAPSGLPSSVTETTPIIIADYDGDGKADIFTNTMTYPLPPTFTHGVHFSKGNNQFSHVTTGLDPMYYKVSPSILNYCIGDFNGDGQSDILSQFGMHQPISIFSLYPFNKRKQIHTIVNGLGAVTRVDYNWLTKPAVFEWGTSSYSYPFAKRVLPLKVVSKTSFDNNTATENDVTFLYSGLKLNTQGRGVMGFDKITKTDVARSITTESNYLLNTTYAFPYLRSVITKQGTTTLNSSYNNYEVYHYGSKRIFPYISSTTSTDFIKQQNILQEFIYTVGAGEINPLLIGKPRIITTYKGFNTPYITTPSALEKTVKTNVFPASSAAFHLRSKPLSVTTAITRSGQPVYSRKQSFTYNTSNGLVATAVSDPGTTNAVTNTFTYNSFGNLTQKATSSPGLSTRTEIYQYDPTNRFVASSYNSSFPAVKTTKTYDVITGWLTKTVQADGFTTNYIYDGFGRPKLVTDNNGGNVLTRYGWSDGHAFTTTAASSKFMVITKSNTQDSAYTFYDRLGRVTRNATKGFNGTMIFVDDRYDSKGQLVRRSNPYFQGSTLSNNTFGYDAYGRTINENRVGGNNTTYAYSTLSTGYEVMATNAAGQVKKTTSDRAGKVIKSEDEGGIITYIYHSNGGIKEAKLGTLTVQTTEYDNWGQKTKETDPNYGSYEYTYNAYGETTTMKDPKAQTYNYSYNVLGVLGVKTGPEGTYTYTYNTIAGTNCGKLTKIVGPESTEETSFGMGDKVTWQKSTIGTEVLTTEFTYDPFGRASTIKYPNGIRTRMGYHAIDGSLTGISKLNTSGGVESTLYGTYGKNALGQISQFAQGITLAFGEIYNFSPATTRLYTSSGLLLEQKSVVETFGSSTSSLISHHQYDFNPATGNLRSRTNVKNSRIERFTFDDLNRLTLSQPEIISPPAMMMGNAITYAANGNIESKSDAGTFSYDIANRVSEIQPYSNIPAATQLVTYKPFNKVADIAEGTWKAEFTYGPSGERNKMLLKEGGVLKKTKYYGVDYEKEIDAATGSVRELCYVTGPDGHYIAIIEKKDGVEKTYYTLTDYLGSITHIMHNGVVVEERSYDAWGRYRNPTTWVPIAPTDVVSNFDRGYTGHEYLPKFGIINMNGRLYDPVMGRMFSADPYIMGVSNSQGFNRYTYALGNPLAYTDPSGNIVWAPIIIGAVVGAYMGGAMANGGDFTPWNGGWNFNSGKTWGWMIGGAIAGGVAGWAGAGVAASGMPFANTAGIAASSFVNSVGTAIYTGGQTDVSVSFGIGNFNLDKGTFNGIWNWNDLELAGKIGFTFGALANIQDVVAAFGGGTTFTAGAKTKRKDKTGHSYGYSKKVDDNIDISVASSTDWNHGQKVEGTLDYEGRYLLQKFVPHKGRYMGTYDNYQGKGIEIDLHNVNKSILQNMTQRIMHGQDPVSGGDLLYGFLNGCQSHVGRSLWAVGIPTLPINFHPYILTSQLWLRQQAIYSSGILTNN